jgi:hypothetical protein
VARRCKLAVSLGLIDVDESDVEKSREELRQWLRQSSEWLMIFDNAEDSKALNKYLLSPATGSVIVTSRSDDLIKGRVVFNGVKLETLSDAEGARFLLDRVSLTQGITDEDRRVASEISRELGDHSLGLATMAAYIDGTGYTLDGFLSHYRKNRSELISTTKELRYASFDYELSLDTCWSMSLESFHGKDSGDLLGILAMLDPDSIAEDLFTEYAKGNQGEVPVLRTTEIYLGAVISLRSHGLINANQTRLTIGAKDIATRLISIHRLIQEAAIRHLVSNSRIHQAFDNTVKFLRKTYPQQISGESMYEIFPECRRLTQAARDKPCRSTFPGRPNTT